MNNNPTRLASLLAKYMRKELTINEREELHEWVGSNQKNIKLFKELTDKKRVKAAMKIINS